MTPEDDRLNSQVRERISGLSDEALLTVVDSAKDYTPFALSVARQELAKRGGRVAVEHRVRQLYAPPVESPGSGEPVDEQSEPAHDIYDRDDYASFWRRAAADFLDGLILGIPVALISLINESVGGMLGLAAFTIYHIGLKSDRGTTLGYRLVGIKLVSMDGAAVTLRRVALRQISSLLSAFACWLGFLWIAFDSNRQAWHDKIAGTYVVRKDAAPVGKAHVSRSRWLRTAAVVGFLFIAVAAGLLVRTVRILRGAVNSEPYHRSEQYLGSDRWIRERVGNPTGFSLAGLGLRGDRRTFSIWVTGDKGQVFTNVDLEQRGGIWWVVSAFGYDDDGKEVDLTGGPFPGK